MIYPLQMHIYPFNLFFLLTGYLLSNWQSSHLAWTLFTWPDSEFEAPFSLFDEQGSLKSGVSGRFWACVGCVSSTRSLRASGVACISRKALPISLARPSAVLLSIFLKTSLQLYQRVFFKKECCLFYFWNQAMLPISFALILFCFPPAPTFFPLCLNYLCAFDWDNPASDLLPFVLLVSLFELLKLTIGVMLMSYTLITGQKLLHICQYLFRYRG